MVGSIIPFAGQVLPEGYLLCDGSAVSRSDYSELFDIVGTIYGSGDGSTTFNLPNLTGKVTLGNSLQHAIGTSGGAFTVSVDESTMPSHHHVIPAHTHDNTLVAKTPAFSHSITQPVFKYTRVGGSQADRTGSTRQAYTGTASASMSRATNLAVADHPASNCTVTGGIQQCSALTLSSTGSGAAHNNLMPYLAVMYIIQTVPDTAPQPRILIYGNNIMPTTPSGCYLVGTKR